LTADNNRIMVHLKPHAAVQTTPSIF